MAVYFPVPNSRPLPTSKPDIDKILNGLTRTPADILGEPPLPPLPPPSSSKSSLSYHDAVAITHAFPDPVSILGEPPLPKQLPPRKPKKRARAAPPTDTKPKRRKKEDKLPSLTVTIPKSVLPPKQNSNQSPRPSAAHKKTKAEPAFVNDKPLNNAHKPTLRQEAPTVTKTENVLKRPGKGKLSDSVPLVPKVKVRSSPHPAQDPKNARKEKDTRSKPRSSLPNPTDAAKGARKIKEQPTLRSSPLQASTVKDTSKDKLPKTKLRSAPVRSAKAKEARKENAVIGIKLRSSPVRPPDVKDAPKEKSTRRPKLRSAPGPHSDSAKNDSKKLPKKPPHSVPTSRPAPRVPRSEPVPSKSTSPEPSRKLSSSAKPARRASSSKADSDNRPSKAVAKDRRDDKTSSRRRDDSPEPRPERLSRRKDDTPERRRRGDRDYARSQRESSVDGKRRDFERKRAKDIDDDLSDKVLRRSKNRDAERSTDSDRDYDRVSEQSSEKRPVKGRNIDRRRRDSEVEYDRYTESGFGSKKGGEKRKREADRVHNSERDRKLGRKDGRKDASSGSDTPGRSPQERDDSLSPRHPRLRSARPESDDNLKDRVQPKGNRDAKNGHNSDSSVPEKTKQQFPKFRSVAVTPSGVPKVPESSGLVSRPVREPPASSSARPAGVKFGQEVSALMTSEERRKSADDLKRLLAEQKDLLSQFDSLTKLCDEYLSKKKHDDFEETVKKAFRVYFKLCLKKETQLRMLQRTNQEWAHVRKEVLGRYKYLTKNFGPMRVEELRQLGRTKTAQFISHQVHKGYFRIFMLQRCWDKEQRSFESDVRRTVNDLFRDGTLGRRDLFGRSAWFVRQALEDYAKLLPLLDAITSDWGDGDHIAGFEMSIPSDC
ncbi:hypothetical protein BWQ96_04511 [Gracilariopsis chorda]|uniref:Uncharacterized protein n=1 Tax=Gracilariopsis chorda TaxID=448386 RepID=A0A2V3IUF7_9FLOR|nr:hypothetical protein BWQ96_04511 [Gracilariopsis chorda]|eukprot:PXF45743.1 hypothetical protein BWQ96_04511 [Gracilariopsis chorda]